MKLKYWIKAARLRTLPLALSCILMGASLALINDFNLKYDVLILTLATTVLLQILSNYANDYGDEKEQISIGKILTEWFNQEKYHQNRCFLQ